MDPVNYRLHISCLQLLSKEGQSTCSSTHEPFDAFKSLAHLLRCKRAKCKQNLDAKYGLHKLNHALYDDLSSYSKHG